MRATKGGLQCTKCGNKVLADTLEVKTLEQREVSPIAVVSDSETEHAKVTETCPVCGNPEAVRNISFISGEHGSKAGEIDGTLHMYEVRTLMDQTIERPGSR